MKKFNPSNARSIAIGAAAASALVLGMAGAMAQPAEKGAESRGAAAKEKPAAQQKAQPAEKAPESRGAAAKEKPVAQQKAQPAPRNTPAARSSEREPPVRKAQSENRPKREGGNQASQTQNRQNGAARRKAGDGVARNKQESAETTPKVQAPTRAQRDEGNRVSQKQAAGREQKRQADSKRPTSTKQPTDNGKQTAQQRSRQQQSGVVPNAPGAQQARLSGDQRTRVRQTILQRNVGRVNRANFGIAIGTRIPRSVKLFAFSAAVLAIVPAYRSYRYVVVDDRICVVEPTSYEIVEVIDDSPGGFGKAEQVAVLELSQDQRQSVLRQARRDTARADIRIGLALGAEVPSGVTLVQFSPELIFEIPQLEQYRYIFVEDDVVIVNPRNRVIVLVIRA